MVFQYALWKDSLIRIENTERSTERIWKREGLEPNQGREMKRNKVIGKDYISLLGLP